MFVALFAKEGMLRQPVFFGLHVLCDWLKAIRTLRLFAYSCLPTTRPHGTYYLTADAVKQ